MLRFNLDTEGKISALGFQANYQYPAPPFISFQNTNVRCINREDIDNPDSWEPLPVDPLILKGQDIEFGNSLLLEFLAGQKDLSLDNTTYRAVSELFHFAEVALRRGDIAQAKTELSNITLYPPVWTQEAKDYFISRIDNYLGA